MIRYLKHKEFTRLHGDEVMGIYYKDKGGKPVIVIPYHATTKTRLHELGHSILNPNADRESRTIAELFNEECNAELYAYMHIGKKPNGNLLQPAIFAVAPYLRVNELFTMCLHKVRTLGITDWQKNKLWDLIIEACQKHGGGQN